jgi:hypothetical protein
MGRNENWNEDAWRMATKHSSGCNCVRRFRGQLIVTRRECSCGGFGMTMQKATDQAISEIGPIEERTRDAIVKRRDELLRHNAEITGLSG